MIEVVALIIFIIILMFTPAAAALTVHSDIEIDSVKTKIKDFFYPKNEMSDSTQACSGKKDDLKTSI